MDNHSTSKSFSYYATLLLGKKGKRTMIKTIASSHHGSHHLTIPSDFSSIQNILFVMPENQMEALYQFSNIISIMNHFHNANISMLCQDQLKPLISILSRIKTLYSYSLKERFLYSSSFTALIKKISHENIDACIFLERNPDLSLLNLVAHLKTKIRISYSEAGEYPFFNIRVQSSNKKGYLPSQNEAIARIVGAHTSFKIDWSIAPEVVNQINHTLKENGVTEASLFGLIDIQWLYYFGGPKWAESCVEQLKSNKNISLYFYAEQLSDSAFFSWLESKQIPCFSQLSPAQIAALLNRCVYVITGNTPFFVLSTLLHRPTIGIFSETEIERYCMENTYTRGVKFSNKPDADTIQTILSQVKEFTVML